MRKIRPIILILLAVFLFTGCRLISPQLPTPTFPPAVTATEMLPFPTMLPTEPAQTLPTPTVSPRPMATATPFLPQKGRITVQNFKLRSGPGFLFDTVSLYDENTTVSVYGRSQGDGWFFVSTPDSRSGWMKADYITLSSKLEKLPVIGYSDASLISGHVQNSTGDPMAGIGIVLFPASSTSTSDQDNAVTDHLGNFYLFVPKNISGNYTIGVNAYNCQSNAVDAAMPVPLRLSVGSNVDLARARQISVTISSCPIRSNKLFWGCDCQIN